MSETSWGDIDPVRAAAAASAPERPKRFYETVALETSGESVCLTLDGRPARTPAKRPLAMPPGALAEAVAAEWRAQGETIDPAAMPATRAANTAIDGVADKIALVQKEILNYAGTDHLCYRAERPEGLCARQTALWDPVIDWIEARFGARPVLAGGVMHVAQPQGLIDAIRDTGLSDDPFVLSGLYTVTALTGSAYLALALSQGRLDAEAVWTAAHVDEDRQISEWGEDAEATRRRAMRRREFDAALLCLDRP